MSEQDSIGRNSSDSMDDYASIAVRCNRFYDDTHAIAASVVICDSFYKVPPHVKLIEDKLKELDINRGSFVMYKHGYITQFFEDYIQDPLKEGWICYSCGLKYCPHSIEHKQKCDYINEWMNDYDEWLTQEFIKYFEEYNADVPRLQYLGSEISRLKTERWRLFGQVYEPEEP